MNDRDELGRIKKGFKPSPEQLEKMRIGRAKAKAKRQEIDQFKETVIEWKPGDGPCPTCGSLGPPGGLPLEDLNILIAGFKHMLDPPPEPEPVKETIAPPVRKTPTSEPKGITACEPIAASEEDVMPTLTAAELFNQEIRNSEKPKRRPNFWESVGQTQLDKSLEKMTRRERL